MIKSDKKKVKKACKTLRKLWGLKHEPTILTIRQFLSRVANRLFPRKIIINVNGEQMVLTNPVVKSFDNRLSEKLDFNVTFSYDKVEAVK